MRGVCDIITARDLAAAGIGPFAGEALPREDGGEPVLLPMPLLCGDTIRHLGEPVAMIVATSDEAALDAAEHVVVDVEPVAPDIRVAAVRRINDPDAVGAVIDASCHIVEATVEIPRLVAAPLECRGCVAVPDPRGGLTLRTSTQNPYAIRRGLCAHFGWPLGGVRVLASDVGGSFGLKGFLTREEALVAWYAKREGRPVAWIGSRSESFVADHQGRGVSARLRLGLDARLRFTGVLAEFDVDLGAYPDQRGFGMANNAAGLTGLYDIPAAAAAVTGRLSPRMPLAPYRGNGRPEVTLAIETLIDTAARQLGYDPVELRRRNLIRPGQIPHRTVTGFALDSGDFPRVLDTAVELAGIGELPERRRKVEARGKLFGFGIAACVESAGGPVSRPRPDHGRVVLHSDGCIVLSAGVMSSGQGHATAFTRMASERLGLPEACFHYVNGDTDAIVDGRGSGGSAGMTVAGSALSDALDAVLASGTAAAAGKFGCAPEDIGYDAGTFFVSGRNAALSLSEVAAMLGRDGVYPVERSFVPKAAVFPNGVHICEVEIDPESGALLISRYTAVEDVGRVHNHDLAAGQLHGGIAMGLAQVLGERVHFDAEGKILSGSFLDYYVARAGDLPAFRLGFVEMPTALNPLGVKGVGEAGTVGAMAALMSALRDALGSAGVSHFDMPATPSRIWQALRNTTGGAGR